MPDVVTDSHSKEANEKHPKKGGKLGKYKWYIIGGLAVIAVLVFYFTRSGSGSSSQQSSAAGNQAAAGIDPATGVPYASEYAAGGGLGMTGPAGPPGATGAQGPPGKTGKQGPPGRPPKKHKPPKKKHNPATVTSRVAAHPATITAAAHRTNTARAVSPKPALRRVA